MFTLFQQGFGLGFFTGAAFVLVFYVCWDVVVRVVSQARARRKRLAETTRFRRTGWLALAEHNESESIDRALRLKR